MSTFVRLVCSRGRLAGVRGSGARSAWPVEGGAGLQSGWWCSDPWTNVPLPEARGLILAGSCARRACDSAGP